MSILVPSPCSLLCKTLKDTLSKLWTEHEPDPHVQVRAINTFDYRYLIHPNGIVRKYTKLCLYLMILKLLETVDKIEKPIRPKLIVKSPLVPQGKLLFLNMSQSRNSQSMVEQEKTYTELWQLSNVPEEEAQLYQYFGDSPNCRDSILFGIEKQRINWLLTYSHELVAVQDPLCIISFVDASRAFCKSSGKQKIFFDDISYEELYHKLPIEYLTQIYYGWNLPKPKKRIVIRNKTRSLPPSSSTNTSSREVPTTDDNSKSSTTTQAPSIVTARVSTSPTKVQTNRGWNNNFSNCSENNKSNASFVHTQKYLSQTFYNPEISSRNHRPSIVVRSNSGSVHKVGNNGFSIKISTRKTSQTRLSTTENSEVSIKTKSFDNEHAPVSSEVSGSANNNQYADNQQPRRTSFFRQKSKCNNSYGTLLTGYPRMSSDFEFSCKQAMQKNNPALPVVQIAMTEFKIYPAVVQSESKRQNIGSPPKKLKLGVFGHQKSKDKVSKSIFETKVSNLLTPYTRENEYYSDLSLFKNLSKNKTPGSQTSK